MAPKNPLTSELGRARNRVNAPAMRCKPEIDPVVTDHPERRQQTNEAIRGNHHAAEGDGASQAANPEQRRPHRSDLLWSARHQAGSYRRDQQQRQQANAAIDEHHRGRQRLRPRRDCRILDPDDVAADVAGEKVVEIGRDRSERTSIPSAD